MVSVAILVMYGIMAYMGTYLFASCLSGGTAGSQIAEYSKKRLQRKRRNLIEELKTPYDEWEAREAECKAMDEAE